MLKKLWVAAALAAATLVVPETITSVEAAPLPALGQIVDDNGVVDVRYRGGGGGAYRGGGGHRGGHRGGYAVRPYVYIGPPAVAYYGYRSYDGGHCAWLRRRAHETGSPYWWQRYRNDC